MKMKKNKKGWIRIVEAVAGILLLAGVLLVMYSQHSPQEQEYDYIYEMQKKVLNEIAVNHRDDVMNWESGGLSELQRVANASFPNSLIVKIAVCELDAPGSCKPAEALPVDREVFVEERIVSAALGVAGSSLKKVGVWVWEK